MPNSTPIPGDRRTGALVTIDPKLANSGRRRTRSCRGRARRCRSGRRRTRRCRPSDRCRGVDGRRAPRGAGRRAARAIRIFGMFSRPTSAVLDPVQDEDRRRRSSLTRARTMSGTRSKPRERDDRRCRGHRPVKGDGAIDLRRRPCTTPGPHRTSADRGGPGPSGGRRSPTHTIGRMTRDLHRPLREAWVVAAVRTPIGRYGGALACGPPGRPGRGRDPGRRRAVRHRPGPRSRT